MTHDVTRAAGRELDALVAERVMGIPKYQASAMLMGMRLPAGFDEQGLPLDANVPIPHYSTDIRAAWEVVEKLALRPPLEALSCVIGTNAMSGGFQNGCKFYPAWQGAGHSIFDAEPHDGWDAVAATIPLAICLAAVRAVGALPTSNTEPE